ncbi:MAG: putative nucleotidyltransferase component of viral defense system [Chlamydiales bacterium]|jgi:predicted nucleotidyltransferase component of viral defense system
MNEAIELMLKKYEVSTREHAEKAVREILQEVVLLGVWRAKLFEQMAFYGGTALRILYGLNRYSEDIDFTLLKKNPEFKWAPFASTIENELKAYGFDFELQQKKKSFTTEVQSAFLKTNTLKALLEVGVPQNLYHGLHPDTILKIKIEVDTDPVVGFRTTEQMLKSPLPVPIKTIELPDLFASKMHAALFRAWKNRTKGRDWYDVVWYIRNDVPINLKHFEACMKQNQTVPSDNSLTGQSLKELINKRIDSLDIESAKSDVAFFIPDHEQALLDTWNKEYFSTWIDKLKIEEECKGT